MHWDIFCKVIDNYGDIGVCWRLAADLAGRGHAVRLWVDDPSALHWMAPAGAAGVEVHDWPDTAPTLPPGGMLVEAFGCEIAPDFIANYIEDTRGKGIFDAWVNLEYLSAEAFVERCHGLPSPVLSGPARGATKYFFYPGFTPRTGGLLRELDLAARQAHFDRAAWAASLGLDPHDGHQWVSLFCYEPPALDDLLNQLAGCGHATHLLVTAGRAAQATKAALTRLDARQPGWNARGRLAVTPLPPLTQHDFDHLLWACDFNFVRGEDSLVRALWAGRPFAWHIYPQHDNAHHDKLNAFLEQLAAPPGWRDFQRVWNGLAPGPLPPLDIPAWRAAAQSFTRRLLAQDDLSTQLIRFAAEKR